VRKRILVLAALGTVIAASFATAAWASTRNTYVSQTNMKWGANSSSFSVYTGLAWQDNVMDWGVVDFGSPGGCLNYIDSSGAFLKQSQCVNGGQNIDLRPASNYSAAYCYSNSSNQYRMWIEDCFADHN
jgi:hypothetical protein